MPSIESSTEQEQEQVQVKNTNITKQEDQNKEEDRNKLLYPHLSTMYCNFRQLFIPTSALLLRDSQSKLLQHFCPNMNITSKLTLVNPLLPVSAFPSLKSSTSNNRGDDEGSESSNKQNSTR